MSRIGKQPIALPKGVEVKIANEEITVKGPKGTLKQQLVDGIKISIEDGHANVTVDEDVTDAAAKHGLYRALISNMVHGVSTGFEKKLEMIGVGYRAALQGKFLDVQVGFSHPTKVEIPEGVTVKVDKNTAITVSGADKQTVGQFAATVRATRPPEPYQGKGIRYAGEYVRKKAGKSAAKK